MTQLTFAEAEYAHKKHQTRRELFLVKMDRLIPWAKLEKKLARHYPKGENGRPPYPLATMLRVHAMQLFYNLSDPALEDALYEIESMRQFAGLRLSERLTVWGDAGYLGVDKRDEHAERKVDWLIAMRPGKRAQLPPSNPLAQAERVKASVRAKVEHSFFYIKKVFGYSKVRYRGLAKNTNRLQVLAAFSNMLMARKYLPA